MSTSAVSNEGEFGKVAVLVPCYNEAATIAKVVADLRRELPGASVYVYDNNSSDNTAELAREAGAVVRHEPRQGKGNVVRQMFREIDAGCYLMVDGDDTYPAERARDIVAPILSGEADMVVGDASPTAPMRRRTSAPSTALATTWCVP